MKNDLWLHKFAQFRVFRVFFLLGCVVSGFHGSIAAAQAQTLPSYKERLFAYPAVLESRDGGDYRIVDYSEQRDINGRDQVPERRVKSQYVDLSVSRKQEDLTLATDGGNVSLTAVGMIDGASVITVFVHGAGGDRRLGANDHTFGGNFNRIKNLMVRAGGLYLSPSAGDFGDDDADRIAAALLHFMKKSPSAKLVLACGSAGGDICYRLARKSSIVSRLEGIAFLGSFAAADYLDSPAASQKVPVFIGHGSRDTVFPVETLEAFYGSLRKAGVPAQMVRFETGTHGTPIRMVDWRETINWLLAN